MLFSKKKFIVFLNIRRVSGCGCGLCIHSSSSLPPTHTLTLKIVRWQNNLKKGVGVSEWDRGKGCRCLDFIPHTYNHTEHPSVPSLIINRSHVKQQNAFFDIFSFNIFTFRLSYCFDIFFLRWFYFRRYSADSFSQILTFYYLETLIY
jgi:hypothetical protein